MDKASLDQALLDAHDTRDLVALIQLYTLAADQAENHKETDVACFYLTHAFVFALEAGSAEVATLNIRLAAYGRTHILEF